VDIVAVREHMQQLRSMGVGTRAIATSSGVSRSTVIRIIKGKELSTRVTTSELLMSVMSSEAAAYVHGIGTARRLRALHAVGWSFNMLAAALQWPRSFVVRLAVNPKTVRTSTAAHVAKVYRQLEYRILPQTAAAIRSRKHATAQGWVGPAAWDGLDMDDPACKTENRKTYRRTIADLTEDVMFLLGCGETVERIAQRLSISESYVRKLRRGYEAGVQREIGAGAAGVDEDQWDQPADPGGEDRSQPAHAVPVLVGAN